jgi:hypothetical protein
MSCHRFYIFFWTAVYGCICFSTTFIFATFLACVLEEDA